MHPGCPLCTHGRRHKGTARSEGGSGHKTRGQTAHGGYDRWTRKGHSVNPRTREGPKDDGNARPAD